MKDNQCKKIIIFGILFLAVCVVAGLIIYQTFILKKAAPPEAPVGAAAGFEQCQKVDYNKTFLYGNDAKDIFYKIAEIMATKNEKACLEFEDDQYKNLCLSDYYKFLTLKNNTSEYREKLSSLGKSTVIGDAYLAQNINLCDGISDILQKNICKVTVSLDPVFCNFTQEKISGSEVCLSVLGKKEDGKENIKQGCEAMGPDEAKSLCQNSYYAVKALKENNINECSQIDNLTGRFARLYCLALLSPEPKEEINKFYREHACYEKYATLLAKEKNDASICEKIPLKDGHNRKNYEECVSQFK